jgi:hypothetical protein
VLALDAAVVQRHHKPDGILIAGPLAVRILVLTDRSVRTSHTFHCMPFGGIGPILAALTALGTSASAWAQLRHSMSLTC